MPLGAMGMPGRLIGLYQWHRLEEFREWKSAEGWRLWEGAVWRN